MDGLPEDNAISRTLNEGRTWTTTHVILWQMLGKLTNIAGLIRAGLQIKTDTFRWGRDPWTRPDDGKTIGHVAKEDQPLAVGYLMAMYQT